MLVCFDMVGRIVVLQMPAIIRAHSLDWIVSTSWPTSEMMGAVFMNVIIRNDFFQFGIFILPQSVGIPE